MITVNIHEAKTHFSQLLLRVSAGEEVVIARAGKPVARPVRTVEGPKTRVPGTAVGLIEIMPDFDGTMPGQLLGAFEG